MDIVLLFFYSIPVVAFGIAAGLGYTFGKWGSTRGFVALGGIWFAFASWMLVGMGDDPTWDGLDYLVAFIGIGIPSAVGAVLGGVIGKRRKEKMTNA